MCTRNNRSRQLQLFKYGQGRPFCAARMREQPCLLQLAYNNKVHVQHEPPILKENLGTLTSESFILFFEVPVCDILGWSSLLIYLF